MDVDKGTSGDRRSTVWQDTQLFLARGEWMLGGEDYFQALARHLAGQLGADYVCIDRLHEGNLRATTLAVYFDGKFEDNVEYTLQDTPCGSVVGKTVCCFPRDVRGLFPRDQVLQDMRAESYVGSTLWDGKGKPIGLIALISRKTLEDPELARDILDLVAARSSGELARRIGDEENKVLLAQKDALLSELNHRVKNSLNLVSGLLEYEMPQLADEASLKAFRNTQERIRTISGVYDRMHLSADMRGVSLRAYIEGLARSLLESQGAADGRIGFSASIPELELDSGRAVPIGLILNEFLTNSLKYAFPDPRKGKIQFLVSEEAGEIQVLLSDDGVGPLPGSPPRRLGGLGLDLIRMMVEQLGGEAIFESGPGFTLRFSFPR
jgi:two-component sensor histidine kinase